MSQKFVDLLPVCTLGSERLRAHALNTDILYVSKGNTLLSFDLVRGEMKVCRRFRASLQHYLFSAVEMGRRLFRLGLHHVVCFREKLVICIDRSILTLSAVDGSIDGTSVQFIGTRPLGICNVSNEKLYYGEYNGSRGSGSSGIFSSDDGSDWREIYRIGNIRHVHGVYFDTYAKAVWVTTGDEDTESGIWVTQDDFKTLNRVIGGSQQTRAVQLLFTEKHVYFGSDTPLEKNFIYRLHKETGRVERLQEVESSVFWGCKVGNHLFFSTAVEPSTVNASREAVIWGSPDGEKWKRIAAFRKDRWPMRLFQYGQIFFPAGENESDFLFFTPFATEKHLTFQRLKVTDLFRE